MKALITGHKGFIGKALCRQLQEENHKCFFFEEDICNFNKVDEKPDVIVHLAGKLNPTENAWPLYKTNVLATAKLSSYSSEQDIPFVFLSTAGVYEQKGAPTCTSEEDSLQPFSDYQISKLLAENIIAEDFKKRGRAITLRLFNSYGPLQSNRFIIGEIISKILRDEPITLKTPNSIRDFIYIDDIVSAIILSMKKLVADKEPLYSTMNLATQQGLSINDLAKKIIDLTGAKIQIEALPQKFPDCSIGDITKIKNSLSWSPIVTLDEGLKRVIEYEKTHYSC